MIEMESIKHFKKIWKGSAPQINHWDLPQQFGQYVKAAQRRPKVFFNNYEKRMKEIDNYCKPENVSLVNMKDKYEAHMRRLLRWQFEVGGFLPTLMKSERGNNTSLELTYTGLLKEAQELYRGVLALD